LKCRDSGTDTHGKTGMRLRRGRMTFENADASVFVNWRLNLDDA
jgi:hypothetical protein